jgi:pyridoxamine 5'-phosphate oxidase
MTLELPEFADPPAEPVVLFQQWLSSAEAADVREPRAATLATADAAGRVSARIVLVKEVTEHGILFGFSGGSRKGSDISANPHAALNFYWRERAQQITINGTVSQADQETSDRLFAARPRAAQALATRSNQSQPIADLKQLHSDVARLTTTAAPIHRPLSWSGWIMALDEIEFWHGDVGRFHRRLQYRKAGDDYQIRRLQP